ncbi:MAG: U32 family peptidase, partial [Paludibacteraceae bacterium]|nr:U32 family peptidase [Paludibacteraceae bacterium]
IDNEYIMSPKDLKTIGFLNKMLDAGVQVLKIEGRARGAEYVKTTVACYREAVEAWQKGLYAKDEVIEPMIDDWNERLARVFNRGFWDGYYQGQRLGEWTRHYGSQATRKKVFAGKCTNFFKQLSVAEFYVEAIQEVKATDELLVTGETTGAYELTAAGIRDAEGNAAERIGQGEFFSLKTEKLIHRGDKLYVLAENN